MRIQTFSEAQLTVQQGHILQPLERAKTRKSLSFRMAHTSAAAFTRSPLDQVPTSLKPGEQAGWGGDIQLAGGRLWSGHLVWVRWMQVLCKAAIGRTCLIFLKE